MISVDGKTYRDVYDAAPQVGVKPESLLMRFQRTGTYNSLRYQQLCQGQRIARAYHTGQYTFRQIANALNLSPSQCATLYHRYEAWRMTERNPPNHSR